MKIVLITRDRPELTQQTIISMMKNAHHWEEHQLVVVWDGGFGDRDIVLDEKLIDELGVHMFFPSQQLGVGGAKNFGVTKFGILDSSDMLMFSDNDMYYLPNWDILLERAYIVSGAAQLGGWRHPYHEMGKSYGVYAPRNYGVDAPKGTLGKYEIREVDAVTGNCFVISYEQWLKGGPFNSNALGPGQSEDFALSQDLKRKGGKIVVLDPPVVIHCGMRNCLGEPATGWEEMAAMAEKQLEENDIPKIWMEVPEEGTILLERNSSGVAQVVEQGPLKPKVAGSNPAPSASYETNSFKGLNVGSGQRRFDTTVGWCNIDCVSRPPDQVPDIILDANKLDTKFEENSQDMVVLHQTLEHFGCGEASEILKQCYKILKPGGSLLIFVPDLRKLAGRWLNGELEDFLFFVNVYGAYQGLEGDRHKWGYSSESLSKYLFVTLGASCQVQDFNWRDILGADIARDFWIAGIECTKKVTNE